MFLNIKRHSYTISIVLMDVVNMILQRFSIFRKNRWMSALCIMPILIIINHLIERKMFTMVLIFIFPDFIKIAICLFSVKKLLKSGSMISLKLLLNKLIRWSICQQGLLSRFFRDSYSKPFFVLITWKITQQWLRY